MDAHHDFKRDGEVAKRQMTWKEEWHRQFEKLSQQDAIKRDPMSGHADALDETVEKALCERGILWRSPRNSLRWK